MKKKNPVVSMRESERRKLIDKSRNEGILFVTVILLSVMRDKFGYGKKRLKRIYSAMEDLAESVGAGYVKLTDLQMTLEEEADITIGTREEAEQALRKDERNEKQICVDKEENRRYMEGRSL